MGNWHMNEKVMTGVIAALIINTGAMIWQGLFVLKTLDTDPPIIERIIRLEYQQSEQGRVNQKIFDKLDELTILINRFGKEQSRRKPLVDYIEKKINSNE